MSIEAFGNQHVLSPRQRALGELLDLSEQILSFAQLGDWGSAVKLQRYRRTGMDQFFAQTCPPSESADIARVIERILELDAQVSDILYNYRNKLVQESGAGTRSIRQLDSYLSNSV